MTSRSKKLEWDNLLDDKCPKCGADLFAKDPGVNCHNVGKCDFFITHERLEQLKESIRERHRTGRVRWYD